MTSWDDPCFPVAEEPCKVPVDYFMPIGTTGVRFVARLDAILRVWGPQFSPSDVQRAELRAASSLAQTGMIRGQAFAFMRNGARLTEAQAAVLCGVDFPTLQAWEAETAPLPMTAWKTLAHYVTDLDGRDHYMTTPPCPPETWRRRDIRVYPDFVTVSTQGPLGDDADCSGMSTKLSVSPSDAFSSVNVYMPLRCAKGPLSKEFNAYSFYPSGTFSVGSEVDQQYVLVNYNAVNQLLDLEKHFSSIEIKLSPQASEKHILKELQKVLGPKFKVSNRYQQDEGFLKIVNIEKWISYLIACLSLLIIAFNLVGFLWMIVLEKKKDIAILKSMGQTKSGIRTIFMTLGFLISSMTEIARLRLFLALVAAAQSVDDLEPLPNIDFNILAGNSLIGLLHKALVPEVAAQFIGAFRGTATEGRSGLMQPIPAEMFNIAQANRSWVDRRCRPQELATFECPALLTGAHAGVPKKHYILADGWDPSPFRHFAKQVDGKAGWTLTKMPCSHDIMVDMPKELAGVLAGMG